MRNAEREGLTVTCDAERSMNKNGQQRQETLVSAVMKLFNHLPVPTIAQVYDLTVSEVLSIAVQHFDGQTGLSEKKQANRIMLLEKPIINPKVPMALRTQNAIRKHREAIEKLQEYLRG
jgi:hypothetical protein